MATARIAQDAEPVQERTQFPGAEGAGASDLFFVLGQVGGQAATTQQGAGAGPQCAQVQLLGQAVLVIEVAAGATVTLGQADGREPAGPVARAAGARLLDETLDDQHRMPPPGLPVLTEPAQAQAEHARGEMGITLPFGQDQEAAVVDDQAEAAGALARSPAQPGFAGLEMEGGGAEGEPGDPLAVELGDVAKGLAGPASAGQVVLGFEAAVELAAVCVAHPTRGDARQDVSFAARRGLRHGHGVAAGAAEVPSWLTPPRPRPHSPRSDEIALRRSRAGASGRVEPSRILDM